MQLVKPTTDDNLPLRGFLLCPSCGKQLTGSASKGRTSYYYYYHCTSSCGVRYKATDVNSSIVTELQRYVPQKGAGELFKLVVKNIFQKKYGSQGNDRKELLNQIHTVNEKLTKARKLLLDDAIDAGDYKLIKQDCKSKLAELESRLTGFNKPVIDLEGCLDMTLSILNRLDVLYVQADTAGKRRLLGSMYPEKLCFDGTSYRTTRANEIINITHLINSQLRRKKIGQR